MSHLFFVLLCLGTKAAWLKGLLSNVERPSQETDSTITERMYFTFFHANTLN